MSATSDAERAAFEATVGKDRMVLRDPHGDYVSTYVQNDWDVWQVARKERQLAACNFCLAEAAKARAAFPIDFKQAADQGGWISVNERLPEPGLIFLVHCQCGGESSGIYTMRLPVLLDKNTRPEGAFNRERVTHWQPLPAAPTLLGVADGDAVGGKSGGAA